MARRVRPQAELVWADFFEEEGWWRVNVATPTVTRRTTRYL